ncbi:MAG TPA: hypothetical protein VGQ59_18705 [Cyclobacteriaceae bacterium]|jgi:hypothetical protein|nr:hypothetical protein [Cyclobacteriaceae bacterium]
MNDIATPIETLFEKAENYSKTSLELFKLTAIDKSADVVSSLVVRFSIFMVGVVFMLVINIGIAMWLGELLGKPYYGFFVVAAFYAMVTTLLYVFRHEWIKTPVSNSIITQMTKQR